MRDTPPITRALAECLKQNIDKQLMLWLRNQRLLTFRSIFWARRAVSRRLSSDRAGNLLLESPRAL